MSAAVAPMQLPMDLRAKREVIEWHSVAEKMPDADITVLIHAPDLDEPVWLGWFDGEKWYAVDATEVEGVADWADVPSARATA